MLLIEKRILTILTLFAVFIVPNFTFAKLKIVTSVYVLKTITKEIAGEKASVESLSNWDVNPHYVPARPSFILKLRRADLFIETGADLEIWVDNLIINARNPKILKGREAHINASDKIKLLEKPDGRIDRAHGDVHPAGNPHFWLDPINASQIGENIYNGLIRIDSDNKDYYLKRLTAFQMKCRDLDKKIMSQMDKIEDKNILVYHKSWIYFTTRYKINELMPIQPIPGVEPTAKYLIDVINKSKDKKVKCILQSQFYDKTSAQTVASSLKIKLLRLPQMPNKDESYIQFMEKISSLIIGALLK